MFWHNIAKFRLQGLYSASKKIPSINEIPQNMTVQHNNRIIPKKIFLTLGFSVQSSNPLEQVWGNNL
jgi:hypothetical protein